MEVCGNRFLFSNFFKKLQILALTSQHLLSVLISVLQNIYLSQHTSKYFIPTPTKLNFLSKSSLIFWDKKNFYGYQQHS